MSDERGFPQSQDAEAEFLRRVESKASRKLRMQGNTTQGVWFGLGMSGLIGWSVAVPTLLGTMAGVWWDRRHPGPHSWTLMLMVIGLVLGCINAWHWLSQQRSAMSEGEMEKTDA
jgi:ATP synthase protein I